MKSEIDTNTFRVDRGGSWNLFTWNVRDAIRLRFGPCFRLSNLGFRLMRTLRTNKQLERWREEVEEGLFNEK